MTRRASIVLAVVVIGVAFSLPFYMSGFRLFQFTQVLIYAIALLAFSLISFLAVYALQRFQDSLVFNPTNMPAVAPLSPGAPRRQIWSLGGGKGGIGKSLLTASLGWQLARMGKRVAAPARSLLSSLI